MQFQVVRRAVKSSSQRFFSYLRLPRKPMTMEVPEYPPAGALVSEKKLFDEKAEKDVIFYESENYSVVLPGDHEVNNFQKIDILSQRYKRLLAENPLYMQDLSEPWNPGKFFPMGADRVPLQMLPLSNNSVAQLEDANNLLEKVTTEMEYACVEKVESGSDIKNYEIIYLPIKLPHSDEIKLPANLLAIPGIREMAINVAALYSAVNYRDYFLKWLYFTLQITTNLPANSAQRAYHVHVDGVPRNDHRVGIKSYLPSQSAVLSTEYPTEYYSFAWEPPIDDDGELNYKERSWFRSMNERNAELKSEAKLMNETTMYAMSPYQMHSSPIVSKKTDRVFVAFESTVDFADNRSFARDYSHNPRLGFFHGTYYCTEKKVRHSLGK